MPSKCWKMFKVYSFIDKVQIKKNTHTHTRKKYLENLKKYICGVLNRFNWQVRRKGRGQEGEGEGQWNLRKNKELKELK